MSKFDPRFNYRDDTGFGEGAKQAERRRFLAAIDAWSDDRKEAILIGIDWLTDYYAAVRNCELWKAREYATDHAAELVMGILFPAKEG